MEHAAGSGEAIETTINVYTWTLSCIGVIGQKYLYMIS